jgi:hypothetical protein
MKTILRDDLIYLAGFLDGDGCIMAQLKPRKDYKMGWKIEMTVQFTQHSVRKIYLVKYQDLIGAGYIRKRESTDVCDLVITEVRNVYKFLNILKPFVRMKRKQVDLALTIIEQLPKAKKDPVKFLQLANLTDQISALNDSKNRKYTFKEVEAYFKQNGML